MTEHLIIHGDKVRPDALLKYFNAQEEMERGMKERVSASKLGALSRKRNAALVGMTDHELRVRRTWFLGDVDTRATLRAMCEDPPA